jgi:hypothetical protein
MRNIPSNTDRFIYEAFGEQNYWKDPLWLDKWFKLTTPPVLSAKQLFTRHDIKRRVHIASALGLYYAVILILAGLIAVIGQDKQIFHIILLSLVFAAISLVFNRYGQINWAGIALAAGIAASIDWSILTTPGGLSPTDIQILFLLIFSDMLFVSILPLRWGWIPAVVNITFSLVVLRFAPHSPALAAMLPASFFPTIFRLCLVHLMATGILWILVAIMRQLIRQADNAQEIVKLQRKLQHQTNAQLREKEELEESILQITEVLLCIANGDLAARIPPEDTPHLTGIVGLLNSLLNRYEHTKKEESEWEQHCSQLYQQAREATQALEQLQKALTPFTEAVKTAIEKQRPFFCEKTLTSFDSIIEQMNGVYLQTSQEKAAIHHSKLKSINLIK